ncbi:MAG: hypothetical protein WDW38_008038 [Sanguina aurantia]
MGMAPFAARTALDAACRSHVDPKPSFLRDDGNWSLTDLGGLALPLQRTPGSVAIQTIWIPTGSSGVNSTANTFMRGGRAIRPVSAVHQYGAKRSPPILQDHVRELDPASSHSNFVKPVSPYLQPKAYKVTSSAAAAWGLGAATAHACAALRSPSARVGPLRDTTLTIEDLGRDGPILGKTCVPGSPNSKLVGGRWRYISAPTDGDIMYTDYYGRYGGDRSNFYGREYHINTDQFLKNRLVGDVDYQRAQASMAGISALRTRPGLVLRSAINSGASAKLINLQQSCGGHDSGLQRLHELYNIAPGKTTAL